MKNRPKEELTTLQVKVTVADEFRRYARYRGFKIKRAAEMALSRWMKDGCDMDMEEFKNSNKEEIADESK